MSIEIPERVIDIGDQNRLGMYRSFNEEIGIGINRLIEGNGGNYRFRLVRRNVVGNASGQPFVDVNLTGAEISFGVGERNQAPVGGSWSLTYNADGTGLGNLAYNITAATLQAALNANPAVHAVGDVTVSKYGSSFLVAFNTVGVKQVFVANVEALQPEMRSTVVTHSVVGDVDTKDIQLLVLRAAPYASTPPSGWTRYVDSGITVTETQAGTATKKAVRKLEFASTPYAGAFTVNFPKPEVVKITTIANMATAEVFTVTLNSGTFNTTTLNSTWFQVFDEVGPVNVWFNNTTIGGVAPAVPAGGRNLAIAYLTADTINGVAAKIATTLDGDAKFAAAQSTTVITVTASTAGARTAGPIDNNSATGGVSLGELTPGADGILKGTFFRLQEQAGSLAIWFSVGGSLVPAGAALCNRQLQVNLNNGDSNATVATDINTVLNADASYTSTVAANVVTATDSHGGTRDAAGPETSGFTLNIYQEGKALTSTINFDGTAAELQAGLEDYWLVTQTGANFTLQASEVGMQPVFVIEESELIYPNGVEGSINLNTIRFFQAFAETDADFISLVFEGVVQFPGELPLTVYQEEISVYRTALDINAAPPSFSTTGSVFFTVALGIGTAVQVAPFPTILSGPCTRLLATLNPPSDGTGADGSHPLFMLAAYAQPGADDQCYIQCGGGGAPIAGYTATILASI